MKAAIRFVLFYYAISLFFFVIGRSFVNKISEETASYSFWFFIFNAILSIFLFPPLAFLLKKLNLSGLVKSILSFLGLLLIWNLIPLFDAGMLMTAAMFNPANSSSTLYLVMHASLLLGFIVTSLLIRLIDQRMTEPAA